jgi:hypothetical protein
MKPTTPHTVPTFNADAELAADLRAQEEARLEREARTAESRERFRQRNAPPPPPPPPKTPEKIRLTKTTSIAGRMLPAGTVLRVLKAPEWPADAVRLESVSDLLRRGLAESAE